MKANVNRKQLHSANTSDSPNNLKKTRNISNFKMAATTTATTMVNERKGSIKFAGTSVANSTSHDSNLPDIHNGQLEWRQPTGPADIKCSAVHTLERDLPQFDYSHLVRQLRQMILADQQENPGCYSQSDIENIKRDDWMVARFLLRHQLDMDLAFDMMRKTMRFRLESLCTSLRPCDFPAEFYQLGALFIYEPDRKGNIMLYLRVKLHRKLPEIQAVLLGYLYYQISRADEEAGGKGISIVFDCTGGGLANADMETLMFIFSTLNNYFPKGLSYLLVHELPWILKPFWHIAKAWIPEEKRELIKFSDSRTIFEYVDAENLPDFMGGICKRDYRAPPENCTTLMQAAKLWGVESSIIKRLLLKFADDLPAESLRVLDELETDSEADKEEEKEVTDDSDQENKY